MFYKYKDVYEEKGYLVSQMNFLKRFFPDIDRLSYHAFLKKGTEHVEEFVVLTWTNGAKCVVSNNANSLSATARNVTRMLDGGCYESNDHFDTLNNLNDMWEEIVNR